MTEPAYRQVIYRSRSADGRGLDDLPAILQESLENNGLDGLSGLLWTNGSYYVQVLEGWEDAVSLTFERILTDPRHRNIEVAVDALQPERAFGDWTMADVAHPSPESEARLARMLSDVPGKVRDVFATLVAKSIRDRGEAA